MGPAPTPPGTKTLQGGRLCLFTLSVPFSIFPLTDDLVTFESTPFDTMSSDNQDSVSRRRFLQSVGIAGVVGASGSLLAACGGSDDSEDSSGTTASADCSDLSDLSESEKKQRSQMVKSLKYVEESPQEDQHCANCQLYIKSEYGEGCGGCQLFPGPVASNGYCNSWAPASQ